MKCDYCGQPGARLVGESNGVIVCQNHIPAEPECAGLCGVHHWLDRPESDTRECLICGATLRAAKDEGRRAIGIELLAADGED